MKKIKRFLLYPVYYLSWIFADKVFRPTFNRWLYRHGYWRLTDYLDNLKLLVPREYRDLVVKYPHIDIPYTPASFFGEANANPKEFYYYEAGCTEAEKLTTSMPKGSADEKSLSLYVPYITLDKIDDGNKGIS